MSEVCGRNARPEKDRGVGPSRSDTSTSRGTTDFLRLVGALPGCNALLELFHRELHRIRVLTGLLADRRLLIVGQVDADLLFGIGHGLPPVRDGRLSVDFCGSLGPSAQRRPSLTGGSPCPIPKSR